MSLKKKFNHQAEHNKTSVQLEKRGIAGFLVTEGNGQTMVTLFGPKQRAMMSLQAALSNNEWMNSMARFVVNGPVAAVNVTGPENSPAEIGGEEDTDQQTVSDYDVMGEPGTILEQAQDDTTL